MVHSTVFEEVEGIFNIVISLCKAFAYKQSSYTNLPVNPSGKYPGVKCGIMKLPFCNSLLDHLISFRDRPYIFKGSPGLWPILSSYPLLQNKLSDY